MARHLTHGNAAILQSSLVFMIRLSESVKFFCALASGSVEVNKRINRARRAAATLINLRPNRGSAIRHLFCKTNPIPGVFESARRALAEGYLLVVNTGSLLPGRVT